MLGIQRCRRTLGLSNSAVRIFLVFGTAMLTYTALIKLTVPTKLELEFMVLDKVQRTKAEMFRESNLVRYIPEGAPELLLYNETKCTSHNSTVTLVYIYSSPDNTERRDFIRQTYGNTQSFKMYNLEIIFVIGKKLVKSGDNNIKNSLSLEQARYGDLVIGDFIESYRNLSWKGLAALNYIREHCNNAKYLIKADDDTIIDTRGILEMLQNQYSNRNRILIGYVREGGHPKRCSRKFRWHRWCVTRSVYPKTYYPPYMLGMGFVYTNDLVREIYEQALTTPVHPVDDIYITGILTENIKNKTMIHLKRVFLEDRKWETLKRLKRGDEIMVGHVGEVAKLKEAWDVIQGRYSFRRDLKTTENEG